VCVAGSSAHDALTAGSFAHNAFTAGSFAHDALTAAYYSCMHWAARTSMLHTWPDAL
jgi:hypothetical protein